MLLKDLNYVNKINQVIEDTKITYSDMENKALLWDLVKCKIRGESISYSTKVAKDKRLREKNLYDELKRIEKEIDSENNPGPNLLNEQKRIRKELETINDEKAQGIIIRSKANIIENDEKCSKFFLQLENQNYNSKNIKTVIVNNEKISDPVKILEEEKKYYENLFAENKHENICINDCNLFQQNAKRLSDEDKQICDSPITVDDCTAIVKTLKNNKTPGTDGLNSEFYKVFWSRIKQLVIDSFLYALESGELSVDQKRAVITLTPKPNKDNRYLQNWRPISLLNTDYKILTKTLAQKLQNVLPSIIEDDQTGYIKGRYIGTNVRTIIDILELTAFKQNPGLMLFLDFEKAFDSISWSFLHKTLEYFNFGTNFCKWITILYKNINACVINNGHATQFFELNRGIRQGCPISALLFVLVAEVMAINLRKNNLCQGLYVRNNEILLTQLADDTTLFLKNKQSLDAAIQILNHFYKCAGLKLNQSKTEVIRLGNINNIALDGTNIKIVEETKALGIIICKNSNRIIEKNFDDKLRKVRNLLNMWKSRNISIKGKITFLNNKVIPMIMYTCAMLYTPSHIIEQFDKLIFDFLWPHGKHHVQKYLIIQNIANGGLKMPDIDSRVKAIKMSWIKRLLTIENNYTNVAKAITRIDNFQYFFSHNNDSAFLSAPPPTFYKQMIDIWSNLVNQSKSANEILNEKIKHNKNMLIDNKPVNIKAINDSNITILKDLFNDNYSLKTFEDLRQQGVSLNQLEYNSLVSCIPSTWMKEVKSFTGSVFKDIDDLLVKINNNYKYIGLITCKEFYWEFVNMKKVRSPALYKWEESYYFANFDWEEIYMIPFSNCRETYIHSLQYQIIHRYFPCKYNLDIWYNNGDNFCDICRAEVDTIEHYFYHCIEVNQFWIDMMNWFRSIHNITFNLGTLDVIFGIINQNDDDILKALNFCILFGKDYIRRQKYNSEPVHHAHYLELLKNRVIVEKYLSGVHNQDNKFASRWSKIHEFFTLNI
jgi:hypothetical protein